MIQGKIIPGCGDTSAAFAIRQRVFVEEQGFSAELEFDDIDATALHALVIDGAPAATARLYERDGVYHIGRVAVLPEFRGRRLGDMAMRMLMLKAHDMGAAEVFVGAQRQAQGFYEKLGFAVCGGEYDEEGVPHVPMKAAVGCFGCGCH